MGVCVSEEGSDYVHMFVCDADYVRKYKNVPCSILLLLWTQVTALIPQHPVPLQVCNLYWEQKTILRDLTLLSWLTS